MKPEILYEIIAHTAVQHGADDDPDNEVGDLQDALKAALAMLTPEQCRNLHNKLLEQIDGGNSAPDYCECDNTHQGNDTVCRWCWNRGRHKWNDPEICDGCDGSGIRPDATAHAGPPPAGFVVIERCDSCQKYSDDLAAAAAWGTDAQWQSGNGTVNAIARPRDTDKTLTCVYCGQAYPPGTPASQHQALNSHIRQCPKHPLAAAIKLLQAIEVLFAGSYDDWQQSHLGRQVTDFLQQKGNS